MAPRSFPALRFAQTTHPAIVRSFSTEVPPVVDAEADEAPVAAASPAAKKFEFQAGEFATCLLICNAPQ